MGRLGAFVTLIDEWRWIGNIGGEGGGGITARKGLGEVGNIGERFRIGNTGGWGELVTTYKRKEGL